MSKKIIKYNPSPQLFSYENNIVRNLVGYKRESVVTTVVQVFKCSIDQKIWNKVCCGILCFIKNHALKSYFFEVYNVKERRLIWEHELYDGMGYYDVEKYFHEFEGEDGVYGFNFPCAKEAKEFALEVHKRFKPNLNLHKKVKKEVKRTTTTKSMRSMIISRPSNFQHLTHVGMDGSFNNSSSDEIQQILEMAGLNSNDVDRGTRDFAVKFIQKKYRKKNRAPLPPNTSTSTAVPLTCPPTPSAITMQKSAQIEDKPNSNSTAPPPPPPPPPTSLTTSYEAPQYLSRFKDVDNASTKFNRLDNSRDDLFNSIRRGEHKLKPVNEREVRKSPAESDTDFKNDIVRSLAIALATRGKSVQASSGSEESLNDDGEWE